MNPIVKLFKSVNEIGLAPLGFYGMYRFGLKVGHFQRSTKEAPEKPELCNLNLPLLPLPAVREISQVLGSDGVKDLRAEADLIVGQGKFAYFGGDPKEICLDPLSKGSNLHHWTVYETGEVNLPEGDVKFIWEPARFGWAFPLARAYAIIQNPMYREEFWSMLEEFNQKNPAMLGPNWTSAQEVAIRLTVFALLSPVFLRDDPMAEEHQGLLAEMIYDHARRIPPTLIYARSQQNNHLITEALGLMVAGSVLDCPESGQWFELGFRWLCAAFRTQIDENGEYAQKSNNYHRLMLQCAIVADGILKKTGEKWPEDVLLKLQSATRWLAAEVDVLSGQVSNYGHNDGAYLFLYDNCGYSDYRPVVQTASLTFLEKNAFAAGKWDEQAFWLGQSSHGLLSQTTETKTRRIGDENNWLQMRSAEYKSRPGHADQLQVDIWHQGVQVALDAGTYLYNGEPPWENSLMTTRVHNTVTVDGRDQMTRAGKFLWLDWSKGVSLSSLSDRCEAYHTGYRAIGVKHQRRCSSIYDPDGQFTKGWTIRDMLTASHSKIEAVEHEITIQWLLPDGEWVLEGQCISVKLSEFVVELTVEVPGSEVEGSVQVCRAGEILFGESSCIPQRGWISPFYGKKIPAISYSVTFKTKLPCGILSKWQFSD